MNALLRLIALITVSALAAGCASGGSSAVPGPPATPVTQDKPVGTGTLTIVYPPTFQRASKAGTTRTSAARRAPAYINPVAGNVIDVYVDGTLQPNLDGVTPSDSATVAASPDGTQTLSIPLYSAATNDIAIVEYDAMKSSVLAVGETSTATFNPGTAPIISVSLAMNVQGIAIAHDPAGSTATVLPAYSTITAYYGCSSSPATSNAFYLFAVDALGGLIAQNATTTTGYGGSVAATLSTQIPSVAVQPETTIRPYNGGYAISYDSAGDAVTIHASVPSNPAAGVFSNSATYPSFTSVPALSSLVTLVNTANATSAISGSSGALLQSGC